MSLLNYVSYVFSCLTYSCALVFVPCWSRALRALVPHVSRVLHALIPHAPGALHILVNHMPCALRALVPDVSRALCALVPHVLCALRLSCLTCLVPPVPCALRALVPYIHGPSASCLASLMFQYHLFPLLLSHASHNFFLFISNSSTFFGNLLQLK